MTNRFTKEQLEGWAEKLIEETHSDIAISRTDAHAESYRAQLALLDIARTALEQPLVHFDTTALDTAREIMCDVNRRHEFLGGDVQLLSRIQCRIDDACRAAILQRNNRDLSYPVDPQVAEYEQIMQQPVPVADETRQNRDLVMMVKLLARTVRKYNPGSQQVKDFTAYLEREGLVSSTDCLRTDAKDPE